MRFDPPLIPARLVRRYKRFLADVEIDGATTTAHCPNPGSMQGLAGPGTPVWLSAAAGASRKLPYTLELVESGHSLVSVHTGRTNALVTEALARHRIAALAPYRQWRREVSIAGGSRLDFLFEGQNLPPLYLEVKSVTLRRSLVEPAAEFPDSVTARGARHMRDLAGLVAAGHRAAVLFLVQRPDCHRFRVADDIDPAYAQALAAAKASGVEVLCYGCSVSPAAIEVSGPLPVMLP